MHRANVFAEVRRVGSSVGTVGTSKGPFTRVGPNVDPQVGF